MTKNIIGFSIVSAMLFTSCTNINNIIKNNKSVTNQKPNWLTNPYVENDEFSAVGCAKIHFKGRIAQEKLAISRAIDQIATQKRLKVQNITLRRKSTGHNSTSQSSSLQSVDNIDVSTKTKALYTKQSGEICAWVIAR